jgi:hypothetical protein
LFVILILVLSTEWFLRRWWGRYWSVLFSCKPLIGYWKSFIFNLINWPLTMKSTHKIRFSAITQLKGIVSCFLLTSVISLNVSAQEIDCEKVKNNRTSYVRKGSVT